MCVFRSIMNWLHALRVKYIVSDEEDTDHDPY